MTHKTDQSVTNQILLKMEKFFAAKRHKKHKKILFFLCLLRLFAANRFCISSCLRVFVVNLVPACPGYVSIVYLPDLLISTCINTNAFTIDTVDVSQILKSPLIPLFQRGSSFYSPLWKRGARGDLGPVSA